MSFKKFRPGFTYPVPKWSGVCSGLAYSIGWKTWIVRWAFIMLTIAGFPMPIIFYFFLAMCLPSWYDVPEDYYEICE